MPKRILIIQGHPDPAPERFCRALGAAYLAGASSAGHAATIIDIATLDFPLLRSQHDFEKGAPPPVIKAAQSAISGADHIVLIYPLWLGDVPALLKGFLEQILRPDFAFVYGKRFPAKLLKGKSARVIVTMGMPALIYRWFFRAHSLKNLSRNVLGFCGIAPVRTLLIGMVEDHDATKRKRWLDKITALGKSAR